MRLMPDFEQGWRQRLSEGTIGVVEVDALHPFRRFYGLDAEGQAQLVFLTEERPGVPPISDLVAVSRGLRESDGRWSLSLTLTDQRFTEIFVRLGADLVRRSQGATSSESGLMLLMTGLDEWRRLLNPKQPSRLSDEQLRGLVGEVWTASGFLGGRIGVGAAVDAWLGPFGNPQDFQVPGVGSFEVKAVRPGAKLIKISSADQLDQPWAALELVVVTLADGVESDLDAVTLTGLVSDLRRRHVAAGRMGEDVDSRLQLLGVDLQDEYYATKRFIVREHQTYDVTEEFPAIRASRLAPGVGAVTYEVSLASMQTFVAPSRLIPA